MQPAVRLVEATPSGAATDLSYVLTNWKMYAAGSRAVDLLQAIQTGLAKRFPAGGQAPTVIVCPPFVSLTALHPLVDPRFVRLGAQNCHWEAEGPYTGEISPTMLKGLVDYVLIGHSERRAAGETDDQIAKKVHAAVEAGLTPILFVGEDEPVDSALEDTERRLIRGLSEVDPGKQPVLVVYEPTWAIGADHPAEGEHVQRVVGQLKGRLERLGVANPQVIYGGTVSAENVDDFAGIDALDGVGATRAGLDAGQLLRIVDRIARG